MTSRTQLFRSPLGLVERVEGEPASRRPTAEEFSPDFQVAFPCRGMFVWRVGGELVVSDPNQVLFVRGGEPFRISDPRPGGFSEVIVTPAIDALRDIVEAMGFDLESHPYFRARRRRATPALQRHCARVLHALSEPHACDDLTRDGELLALLRHALRLEGAPAAVPSAPTRRLIRRTKELLDTEYTRRIRLTQVASAVGASPAYLTDVFRRFEGISLQRYVTQLRLARALTELPRTDGITALALDLGFSSHSHFTLAFRRAFGCTPSEYRRSLRPRSGPAGWPSHEPERRTRATNPSHEPELRTRATNPSHEPEPRTRTTNPDSEPEPRTRATNPSYEPGPRARAPNPRTAVRTGGCC